MLQPFNLCGSCLRLSLLLLGAVCGLQAEENPLDRAIVALAENRLDQAEPLLRQALQGAEEGGVTWQRAAFGLANILHQAVPRSAGRVSEAQQLYEAVLAQAGDEPMGVRSRLLLGKIAEWRDYPGDLPDYEQARGFYLEVVQRAPEALIGLEAAVHYAGTWIKPAYAGGQDGQTAQAERDEMALHGVAFLEAELQRRPPGPMARGAWEYLGEVYAIYFRDPAKGLAASLHATGDEAMLTGAPPIAQKLNLDRINQGYLYWRIARLAEQVQAEAVAIEYYTRIILETPSYKGPHAQRALRALGVAPQQIPSLVGFGPDAEAGS